MILSRMWPTLSDRSPGSSGRGLARASTASGGPITRQPRTTSSSSNLTSDQLAFDVIQGQIPNRGLLQPDINMFGLTYLQQVSDKNLNAGLHIEPGLWVDIPATTDPKETPSVARLASIPHGTTILAQGTASTSAGAPGDTPGRHHAIHGQ